MSTAQRHKNAIVINAGVVKEAKGKFQVIWQ